VDHGPGQDGDAAVVAGDAHPVEPGLPPMPEMSLDADLVVRDGGVISIRSATRVAGDALVVGHTRTVRPDVVSRDHHRWGCRVVIRATRTPTYRSSSSALRTAARRLLTPSLA